MLGGKRTTLSLKGLNTEGRNVSPDQDVSVARKDKGSGLMSVPDNELVLSKFWLQIMSDNSEELAQ